MANIQMWKRHRNWPRPTCPACGNIIESFRDADYTVRDGKKGSQTTEGVRHTLCGGMRK